jgi:hypothetical protein
MVVFNTFHHTKKNPRFRVFIPTTGVMTPEAYTKIWDQIALKIRDAGYSVGRPKKGCRLKRSGLDKTKRTPTSLFYLPCQAQNAGESFFKDFNGERAALDPADWIENSAFDFEAADIRSYEPQQEDREPDQARIEAAMAEWRMTSKGEGNSAFFKLAVELKKAGMGDGEIEATLSGEAQYAHSPCKRQRQIPSIMGSLRKRNF